MNDDQILETEEAEFERLRAVDVLATDFLARYRNGDRPTPEEYANRHPDLADDIRRIFPLVASVEKIKIDRQESFDGKATLAGRELSRLGDFRIIREIGRGGMGIVFEAEQESLDRRVAIKVLPKQTLLNDHELERFHVEAQTAASMHHSNIVPVFGTGEFEGSHYLVMQLVRGESLDKVIKENDEPLPIREVAMLGQQISDAMAYAHDIGVLHRDLKPANILLQDDRAAQITDFGLAKNLNDDRTTSRSVFGSLRYMAPERMRGISKPGGDVYGIGLTLYELLVGRPAFEQEDPNELLAVIANPPEISIRKQRRDIPVDLETIVLKAMHADSMLRYQTAAEVRDDLRRFLADEPIEARRTPLIQKLMMWCRRDPKTSAAALIACLALVTATVVSSVAWFMTAAANDRTTAALDRSEAIVDLSMKTLDDVVGIVSVSPSASSMELGGEWELGSADEFPTQSFSASPQSAKILESLKPLYQGLIDEAPSRPDIIRRMVGASVQHARILNQLGDNKQAIETLQQGIGLLAGKAGEAELPQHEKSFRLASLHNKQGDYFSSAFKYSDADEAYEKAVSILNGPIELDSSAKLELARAYLALGDLRPHRQRIPLNEQQTETCVANVNKARDILDAIEPESNAIAIDVLKARVQLGLSKLTSDPTEQAETKGAGIKILKSRLSTTPDDATVRYELVKALSDQNLRKLPARPRVREIADQLSEALLNLDPLRSAHPSNATYAAAEVHIHHKLANLARRKQNFAEAESQINKAIQIQSQLVEWSPENISHRCWRALLYRSLAGLNSEQNEKAQATSAMEKAMLDIDAIPDSESDHPFVKRVRDALSTK